jgi:hypothetical protein
VLVRLIYDLNGLLLLDVSDPTAPRPADWLAIPDRCLDVAVDGHHAYALTETGDVHVVDLENTGAMMIVATVPLGEGAGSGSLAIRGQNLFVTGQTRGLNVVAIGDPANGILTGAAWVPLTGRVTATSQGFVVSDAVNLQQAFLPPLCGSLAHEPPPPLPTVAALWASPNPFNPSTHVVFDLRAPGRVDVVVYDLAGRPVRTLARDRQFAAGVQRVPWDGRTDDGRAVASGVYLVRLKGAATEARAKLTLVR